MKLGKQRTSLSGFTLVEILIVVAIIAMLASFLLLTLNYKTQIQKARDAKRKNDLAVIKNRAEDYYNDNESYASPPGCSVSSCCVKVSCRNSFLSPYLASFPCDPQQKEYVYCADRLKSSWYKIYTNLENLKDNAINNSGCGTGCLVVLTDGENGCYNYGVSSANTSIATGGNCTPVLLTPTPSTMPPGTYYACQGTICNIIINPESRCGPGEEFPVCCLNRCPVCSPTPVCPD